MELFANVPAATGFAPEKMKKNNLFTTARFFCDVYCFEPGQVQPLHTHSDSDKVYYVLEGTGRIRIGDDERDAQAGTAVLAPADVAHGVVNPGPGRLSLLVFVAPQPS